MNANELKNRSENRLKRLGITVPIHLPEIESVTVAGRTTLKPGNLRINFVFDGN
jgi:hypothetical protein